MENKRRQNVLLIQADQLRYDALGCTGNPHAITPHLDHLAELGTNFHRHIVANPVCMPSRASLFTGRYPSGHGLWHNGVALPRESYVHYDPANSGITARPHESQVISNVPTMPDAFAAAGYETRAIGKLHLTPTGSDPWYGYEESRVRWLNGEMDDWHGPYYGFDHVEMAIGHGEQTVGHYRQWLDSQFPDVTKRLATREHRNEPEFPELPFLYPSVIPIEAHHSTWIAERASAFLDQRSEDSDPFFLYLGFPDPHHPFTPPVELANEFVTHQTLPAIHDTTEILTKPSAVANLIKGDGKAARLSTKSLPSSAITRMRQYTDAMVHLIDQSVGKVLNTLEREGMADNTIVVFTSDHGDFLGDHQLMLKDTVCSSALVHVPFLMRAPGHNLLSATSLPMSNTDVLPTLCCLAGIEEPLDVQRINILSAIQEQSSRHVQVYGYQHEASQHNFSIYDDRFRSTWYPATDEFEMYDHTDDPHELRNRFGEPGYQAEEKRLFTSLLRLHIASDNPAGGRIARF